MYAVLVTNIFKFHVNSRKSVCFSNEINQSYPDSFETDGRQINNKNDIANGFNIFFANIGKELASKIDPPVNGTSINDYLKNKIQILCS